MTASLTVSHLVPHAVVGPSPSGAAKESLDLAHLCTPAHTSSGLGTGQQACSHLDTYFSQTFVHIWWLLSYHTDSAHSLLLHMPFAC